MSTPLSLQVTSSTTVSELNGFVKKMKSGHGPLRATIKHVQNPDGTRQKVAVLHERTWGQFLHEKLWASGRQISAARATVRATMEQVVKTMEGAPGAERALNNIRQQLGDVFHSVMPDARLRQNLGLLDLAERIKLIRLKASQEEGENVPIPLAASVHSSPEKTANKSPALQKIDSYGLHPVPEGRVTYWKGDIRAVQADTVIVSSRTLGQVAREIKANGMGKVLHGELARNWTALKNATAGDFVGMPAGELPADKVVCVAGVKGDEASLNKADLKGIYKNIFKGLTGTVALEPIVSQQYLGGDNKYHDDLTTAGYAALREAIQEARQANPGLSVQVVTDDQKIYDKLKKESDKAAPVSPAFA